MESLSPSPQDSDAPRGLAKLKRAPRRLTVTLPYTLYDALVERSDLEGRSLSNLAAFLLEVALEGTGPSSLPFRASGAGLERFPGVERFQR